MKSILSIIFLVLLFTACKKASVETNSNCLEAHLAAHQLVKYTGQDFGCKLYVTLYELEDKLYFHTDSRCADMLSIPIDCEGNAYCADANSAAFEFFFDHAVNKGIIGFKE